MDGPSSGASGGGDDHSGAGHGAAGHDVLMEQALRDIAQVAQVYVSPGRVHTPLVVAQGALGDSGQGGELALGDLAGFKDGDHSARVLPQARLVEVLTCENGG